MDYELRANRIRAGVLSGLTCHKVASNSLSVKPLDRFTVNGVGALQLSDTSLSTNWYDYNQLLRISRLLLAEKL